jgi:tetratricopeptide (TPR) repeat protein
LLESGARRIELEMKDEPEVQAMMLDVIGKVYRTLGEYDKSEKFLTEGLEIRKSILGDEDIDVALSYFNLGELFHYKNDYDKAMEFYHKALQIRKNHYGMNNLDVAHSIDLLGRLERDKGNYNIADSLHKAAFEIRKNLAGENNIVTTDSYHSLGMISSILGKYEESEKYFRKEAEILSREGKEYPALLHALAGILESAGKFAEADSLYRRNLDLSRKYYGDSHPFVANTLEGYALLKNTLGQYDSALVLMLSAAEIRKEVFGEKSRQYSLSLNNIGRVYQNKNQHRTAIEYIERAIQIAYQVGAIEQAEGTYLANLAQAQFAVGEYQSSISSWEKVLETDRKSFGDKHPYIAEDIAYIAKINIVMGNITKAEQLYRESLSSSPFADAMLGLGSILTGKGETEAADTLLRRGLELVIKKRPEGHPQIAYAKELLGENLTAQKKYDEAEKYLQESYTSSNNRFGSEDQKTIDVIKKLIKLYNEQGKFDKVNEMKAKLN